MSVSLCRNDVLHCNVFNRGAKSSNEIIYLYVYIDRKWKKKNAFKIIFFHYFSCYTVPVHGKGIDPR